jgi:2-methylcitrate dehydratase PrpD
MAKHLHSAKAASSGVLAAVLAREGFHGSPSILEGPKGFLASSSEAGPEDLRRLTAAFGRPFLITRNFFKRYACCRACFEGIEAIERLRETGSSDPEAIRRITVTMKPHRLWLVGVRNPATPSDAKFSLSFCMALMALKGQVSPREFTVENLRDPAIRRFMRKIALVPDPACPSKAVIGIQLREETAALQSEPVCRSLDLDAVARKFVETMIPLLDRSRIEKLLTAVDRLDRLESLAGLGRLLATPPKRRTLR